MIDSITTLTVAGLGVGQDQGAVESDDRPAARFVVGEAASTDSSGRTVNQVDGSNGENRIRVEGSTPAEAWHRAVLAAVACGMLADWPRP